MELIAKRDSSVVEIVRITLVGGIVLSVFGSMVSDIYMTGGGVQVGPIAFTSDPFRYSSLATPGPRMCSPWQPAPSPLRGTLREAFKRGQP